jgi:hypothetical protein
MKAAAAADTDATQDRCENTCLQQFQPSAPYLQCNSNARSAVCCQVDEWQALLECQLSSSPEQSVLTGAKGAHLGGDVIRHSNDLHQNVWVLSVESTVVPPSRPKLSPTQLML